MVKVVAPGGYNQKAVQVRAVVLSSAWSTQSTYAKGEDGTVQHADVQRHAAQSLVEVPLGVGIVYVSARPGIALTAILGKVGFVSRHGDWLYASTMSVSIELYMSGLQSRL